MTRFLFAIIIAVFFAVPAFCQTEDEKICITREAAQKCVECDKERIALADANKRLTEALSAKDEVIKGKDALIIQLQMENAMLTGRLTALEQAAVETRAIIQAMIPMLRKRNIGIITF